jgi:hypothetical protein
MRLQTDYSGENSPVCHFDKSLRRDHFKFGQEEKSDSHPCLSHIQAFNVSPILSFITRLAF